MWQKENKDNSIFNLALLFALATIPTAGTVTILQSALAQSATHVPLPSVSTTVPTGTAVRIDGSRSMAAINQTLKQRFEKQSSGTTVDVAASGTDTALNALQDGTIDLAAISRELTPEEKAKGFEQILLRRDKIAIVVSKENPFKGSLTSKRFAKVFRGEITNWSQLGGPQGTIRFLDHPITSDTREALRDYPVFQNAQFGTGSTSVQLNEGKTPELAKQLGKDGISYILANQASKLQDIRIVSMNHILPKDPRYPFSLASVYVYKKNPSPIVSKFLSFATSPLGQQAIEEAVNSEATAIASGKPETVPTATNTLPTPSATNSSVTASLTPTTSSVNSSSVASAVTGTTNQAAHQRASDNQSFLSIYKNIAGKSAIPLLWWLLPLFALGGFLVWWLRGRRGSGNEVEGVVELTPGLSFQDGAVTELQPASSKPLQYSSSNFVENSTPATSSVSNQAANSTAPGGATLADGQVLSVGTSSPLWLKFFERASESKVAKNTREFQNGEKNSLKAKEVVVDEQPDTTTFTELPKYSEVTSVTSTTGSVLEQPQYTKDVSNGTSTTAVQKTSATLPHSPEVAAVTATETGVATNGNKDVKSHIILTPRTPKWAYACWEVPEYHKEALRQQGGSQLMLRLYDVTNVDLSYQSPKQIQQYECEETIHDRYVAIPTSDRDYMAEIGYVTNNNRWLLLARSSIARVSSRPEQDFWFMADAELIIHGAAEPGSIVSIGGHAIKLKPDGTFHLRIPFRDELINCAMTAVTGNGEHTKTIQMQFFQGTPEELDN
jgi:phosphate transport system substrate-binding protein